MWRDRTNLYISYRSSYSHRPIKRPRFASSHDAEDRQGLLSGDHSSDTVIEMSSLPPVWTDIQDEVSSLLSTIAAKSSALDKLHAKHVLPGFDDNRIEEEKEIERLTTEITAGFHRAQNAIQRMGKMGREDGDEGVMRKNAQMALAQRVQEVSTVFRKKQSAYLKKLRGLNGMERASSPLPGSSFRDEDDDVLYSQSTLQRQSTLTSNDVAIAQREREITDIAKGIIELADIFKELQTMVIDQGTLLDRIDYNIERMNVSVKAADKELTVATGYQRRTLKRKIMLLLILIIFGVIILLTLKPRRHDSPPPPPKQQPPSAGQPGDGQKMNPGTGKEKGIEVKPPEMDVPAKIRRR